MAEIINLNRARKTKARLDKKAEAAANRTAFGRTKIERTMTMRKKDRAASRLDGHRLETPDDDTAS